MNLFPTETIENSDTEILQSLQDDNTAANFLPGYKIDDITHDFVLDGTGKPVSCDESESWYSWCKKVIETPRYKCLAYSTDIGIDIDSILSSSTQKEAETRITTEISEALKADPYNRTDYVENVSFDWISADSVLVTVSVVGKTGSRIEISTTYTG